MKIPTTLTRLVALLAFVALAPATGRAEIIERVLVKVNGDILTQTDLEQRQAAALRARKENTQAMTNAQLTAVLNEITPKIIVDAIDELLLLQRGKELNYKLSDERFKQILENIKKENKFETEEQFQTALKAENMTLADLRKSLERSMILQQVQGNEIWSRISITEAEGKAYYAAHQSDFTTPASMMLREILVTVPNKGGSFSVGDDEAAKAKADGLLARAKAGEGFESLVASSSDAPSKANGGLIGPISLGDLEPKLRATFEPLKQGDITPVIRTASGYQIFKVESLTPAKVQTWEEAREAIGNKVAGSKQQAEFDKYMTRLRTQAIIEWKNDDLKKMYEKETGIVTTGPPPPPSQVQASSSTDDTSKKDAKSTPKKTTKKKTTKKPAAKK